MFFHNVSGTPPGARQCSPDRSAAILGIDAYPVDVEVDISSGLPSFYTVGLPQARSRGRERIAAALANAGYSLPLRRITVNLAPPTFRKPARGSTCPSRLVSSWPAASFRTGRLQGLTVVGEIGLEGDLRPVRGALPMALAARAPGAVA